MMKDMIQRFQRSRRGAVFIIFAIAIVPLLMVIGLSIDYSFYAQARAQFQLAGDAAATYAIREATATYALETQAGSTTYPNPETDAETAGRTAGNNWFATQIATLPTAYLSSSTPSTSVVADNTSANVAAGFTATVGYTGIYPPFFDLLFKSSKNWYVNGTSAASSSYSYIEVLLMLDTSGSMLIGANPSDITQIDKYTACVPNADMSWTTDLEAGNPYPAGGGAISTFYNSDSRDSISNWSQEVGYTGTTQTNGACNHGYNGDTNSYGTTSTVMAPCAFACHTAPFTSGNTFTSGGQTYSRDFYGVARSLNPTQTTSANGGVTLRIDALFLAAENVIQDMISQQQVNGQFSLGVYQFNDDVYCIYAGGCNGVSGEASTGLSAALSAVKADDWMSTPTETAVPKIAVDSSAADGYSVTNECECFDYDNFPLSMQHLQSGALATGTSVALSDSGTGQTATTPVKDLIIVTDALNDSTPGSNTAVNRLVGEMDGINAEAAGGVADTAGNIGVCNALKNMGYTIYILYVQYYPVPNLTYYKPFNAPTTTAYTNDDFSAISHVYAANAGGAIENMVEGDNTGNTQQTTDPLPAGQVPPDLLGIAACASGTGSVVATGNTENGYPTYVGTGAKATYFEYAQTSSDITAAMNTILKNALSSTTRITQ